MLARRFRAVTILFKAFSNDFVAFGYGLELTKG